LVVASSSDIQRLCMSAPQAIVRLTLVKFGFSL
jgi:hypothetical protein